MFRKILGFAFFITLAILTWSISLSMSVENVEYLETDMALEYLRDKPEVIFLDLRGKNAIEKEGKIPGAKGGFDKRFLFIQRLRAKKLSKSEEYVIYLNTAGEGELSYKFFKGVLKLDVKLLKGGYSQWVEKGYPLDRGDQ